MKGKYTHVNDFFNELDQIGVDLKRMNASDIDKIKSVANQKNYIVWITDYSRMSPYFINNFGTKYYGFNNSDIQKHGHLLYEKFLHPEHFNDVHKTISKFTYEPNGVLEMPYRVKNINGEWRWTFSIAKTLNFKSDGTANLVLAIVFDLRNLIHLQNTNHKKFAVITSEDQLLFDSLTERELDVLKLLAKEKTSNEIGADLNIAATTVNAHKNNMVKKLGVKNSFGLMRYATIFNL